MSNSNTQDTYYQRRQEHIRVESREHASRYQRKSEPTHKRLGLTTSSKVSSVRSGSSVLLSTSEGSKMSGKGSVRVPCSYNVSCSGRCRGVSVRDGCQPVLAPWSDQPQSPQSSTMGWRCVLCADQPVSVLLPTPSLAEEEALGPCCSVGLRGCLRVSAPPL